MNKNKVQKRRQNVLSYLRDGDSESQISKTLNVSRQTIVRDVQAIKNAAHSWLDDLANGGFVFEYKLSLEQIQQSRINLKMLYDEAQDIEQKRRLLKSLDDNVKLYLEILGNAPTIHAYRRAIAESNNHV